MSQHQEVFSDLHSASHVRGSSLPNSAQRSSRTDRRSNEIQFQRYDAVAIEKYYSIRPWLYIWRTLVVVWCFGTFIFNLQWDKWTGQTERNKQKRASQLRKVLTYLGPTFIKVGQALSTRPDLIRKSFLEEL
ncbi:MAG: hypothetical protein MUD14_24480 [Hydrococcus sp. Prado102]|nr:hypothetical protein [Hydrococcus sp. Prado102]